MPRFSLLLLLTVMVPLAATAPARAQCPASATLGFDDLAAEQVVVDQYANLCVTFVATPGTIGLSNVPIVKQVPAGEAQSGDRVALISNCFGCEFYQPLATIRFGATMNHVEMRVGEFDADPGTGAANVVLTGYDINGATVAQSAVAVTPGGGFHTLLAIDAAGGNIASVTISAPDVADQNKLIGIDDLAYTQPAGAQTPDFNLSAPIEVAVAPGRQRTVTIEIHRFNGSSGAVLFAASGLPTGVTATFVPNPATHSTQLRLTAAASAPATNPLGAPVTITGTPTVATAGPAARTTVLRVVVRPDFVVHVPTSVDLPTCTKIDVDVEVICDLSFTNAIAMRVSGVPAGITAVFNPAIVVPKPALGTVNHTTLTITPDADAILPDDFDLTVSGTSGGETSSAVLHVHSLNVQVVSVDPAEGNAPQGLARFNGFSAETGTLVTIHGVGFRSGMQFQFGNQLAHAAPEFISADGTEARVRVPRLATDGTIGIVTPLLCERPSTVPFVVHTFRNTNGYSFHNYDDNGYSFRTVTDLYGYDQTLFTIDLCWPFGCDVPVGPDPFALLYTKIMDSCLDDGQCYGMARTAAQFLHHDKPLNAFPQQPGGVPSIWNFVGPAGPTSSLQHFIHTQHLAQSSAEAMHHWLANWAFNSSVGNCRTVRDQIADALMRGDRPLICINNGTAGHCIMAYGLEPGDDRDFYVDVWDNNAQFLTAENTPGDGVGHADREGWRSPGGDVGSRLHVTCDGWDFPNLTWSGGLDGLEVLPYGTVPTRPTIPSSVKGITTIIFGDASASTRQLDDGAGHTLYTPAGVINRDPATRIRNAAPFAPYDAHNAPQMYVLGDGVQYGQTVVGSASGTYDETVFGADFATQLVDVTIRPGVRDRLAIAPQTGIGISSETGRKDVTAQLMARMPDGFIRNAQFVAATYAGGHDTYAFTPDRGSVVFAHHGPPTKLRLVLSQMDRDTTDEIFITRAITVTDGDSLRITPSDWYRLFESSVEVTGLSGHGRGARTVRNAGLTGELRADLRRALRARSRGDCAGADQLFARLIADVPKFVGKHLDPDTADALIGYARSMIGHCP